MASYWEKFDALMTRVRYKSVKRPMFPGGPIKQIKQVLLDGQPIGEIERVESHEGRLSKSGKYSVGPPRRRIQWIVSKPRQNETLYSSTIEQATKDVLALTGHLQRGDDNPTFGFGLPALAILALIGYGFWESRR